jgi:hypothetical protein
MNVIKKIRLFFKFLNYTRDNEMQDFAIGINSYIDKDKDLHCLFIDYDIPDLEFVRMDLSELVQHFHLSDYEIYSTSKGYHIFFWFDHIPYSRVKMILDYSRCDYMFKNISKFYSYKTIRCVGKYKNLDIKFIGKFTGVRKPTQYQLEIGGLKRQEYIRLKSLHSMLNKNNLKNNKIMESGVN